MRERFSNVMLGVIWILIALLIIFKAFGILEFEWFFDGWWTLFIIVPSVLSIVKYGFGVFSSIGLYTGLIILLSQQNVIRDEIASKLLFPGIMIIIGLKLILSNLFGAGRNISDRIKQMPKRVYAAVFSGSRIVTPPEEFYGAEMNSVFGGLTVDLRNTTITEDIVIDVSAIFGGITIYLPENVAVGKSALCLFGGLSAPKRRLAENGPKVYIEGSILFGGVSVL